MKMWMVRPNATKNTMRTFLDRNVVAIGWSETGNLTGKTRGEIKEIMSNEPYNLDSYARGSAASSIDAFVNKISPGDLVLAPNGEDVHIGKIEGDYTYDPGLSGTPHTRKVEWLKTVDRRDMSMDIRSSLKARRTVGDFTKHVREIELLSRGESYKPDAADNSTIDLSYPLRPDFMVSFKIPVDMSQEEADRLATYLRTLYFE